MGTKEERPAKAYFKKMYENEIYEVHLKQLKGTLIASSSDLWDLMEGFSKEKTQHQTDVIERSYKLFKKILELKPLWLPVWTKDPPIEYLDEAIALRSIEKRCQMMIDKISAESLIQETKK